MSAGRRGEPPEAVATTPPPRASSRAGRRWRRDTFESPSDFSFTIPDEARHELGSQRASLRTWGDGGPLRPEDQGRFPRLVEAVARCRRILDEETGFLVIDGLDPAVFSPAEQTGAHWLIANLLGEPMAGNRQGHRLVRVEDLGKSMTSGGRYHQTREGGSHHTDSPQWPTIPDYVGLLCVRPAKVGGESQVLSGVTVLDELERRDPALFEILLEPFHFDKRGEHGPGEAPTTRAPIARRADTGPRIRYLRDYVEAGHVRAGQRLTGLQRKALDALDDLLGDERFIVEFPLRGGQIAYLDNHTILHGRHAFEDDSRPDHKRLLIRVWIQARDE